MRIFLLVLSSILLSSLMFTSAYSDDLIILGKGHAPIYVSNGDSGRFDFDNDGTTDYFVKAHYTGNSNQPLKIDYKIQDECVDLGLKDASDIGGDTFEDAAMKIGFSTNDRRWLIDEATVWNPWFKNIHNDENNIIDLISPPFPSFSFFYDDVHGDDVIQGTKKHGSFQHLSTIKELDDQSGWNGSVFLNAPPGNYILWTIHPADGFGGCDGLSGFGIPISITE
ncbi:MAG TPA: hypothetical protein VFN17_00695 [Nitrosarchaeum sp.]|nr:hypothetical protein [Nitrosarchaeum sp.]